MSNKLLKVNAGVLYYEDGTVNGIDDISYDEQKQGVKPRIPCVQATEAIDKADSWLWCIDIDAEDGIILNWEKGIEADVHYKVCDQCEIDYFVGGVKVCDNDGNYYCPRFLCPEENGYGDYIIMHISADGQIENWNSLYVKAWVDSQKNGGEQ